MSDVDPNAPPESIIPVEPAVPEVPAVPAILPLIHAEIDALWAAILVNISSRVETPIHNFIHDEYQSLKDRITKLF